MGFKCFLHRKFVEGGRLSSLHVCFVSQQTTTPTGRQLTIFYGGQAHVFDDVPSDKVATFP